ncbi:MAG: amino acid permease [Salinivirgaceae bacterium]|nr:amino acid permease [Salinivirgaceae bacterium]MDD4746222.1 amino acid permease [Salinivirgaceae bacterium]MDY0279383.1 amino acid permease [Salinivirgaceae bacterium]
MSKIKKFGTFGGVFTPSILTILGVIMYLRFPVILGQTGLINTIGIIVIAHIISITTSLSVASLSTDKPVRNGGTYFMISRSLGLPIGGTLGLALFVGLSFSVSLYLIGFSESFLQYWDIENSKNAIRITGTIVLIVVTTITFISTSLAIKSQYIIMGLIVLSFLSILLGNHEFTPTTISLKPIATAAPFMVLFGIFFPAVTGFEAGVSMSGDLKDAKKSLPLGAIMAVGVGFVIYILFALFYTFTVDAHALANDPQILFKISLVPVLVIAGIWGATLSSALGSILGAPRILQAIAMDKIAPKIFAKGTGKTNEPRNALLLVFLIAEVGILIGELDLIARIVSMFFITTYAFLNLASAIESWSSSDFRPAFKVPRFVSVLGTLSAFIVMILLDFLALAGATVVLGVLYFYLQRKELILESGDAWSSFWTSLAKRSLLNLSVRKPDKRNWRPNIILFSGGEKARPHLVEIGLSLTGKLGALTDFNLLIDGKQSMQLDAPKKSNNLNYFVRELSCPSIQEGIETITSVYGFSGFEPNTVLMGFIKDPTHLQFFNDIIGGLKLKKLNAIFLNYNKNKGFGKKQNVDVWWNGKGRHLSFSLNALQFLLSDPTWLDTQVRIMVINSDTSQEEHIIRNTNSILSEKRMKAEVCVLSDDFGSRSTHDIIQSESNEADLIILGVSQKKALFTDTIVADILSYEPSSLILSSTDEFEEITIVEKVAQKSIETKPMPSVAILQVLPPLGNKVVQNRVEGLDLRFQSYAQEFANISITKSVYILKTIFSDLAEIVSSNKSNLERIVSESDSHEIKKAIIQNHYVFLRNVSHYLENKIIALVKESEELLNQSISKVITQLGNTLYETPDSITLSYFVVSKNRNKDVKVRFHSLLNYLFEHDVKPEIRSQLIHLEDLTLGQIVAVKQLVLGVNDTYEKLLLNLQNDIQPFLTEFDGVLASFSDIDEQLSVFKATATGNIHAVFRAATHQLATNFNDPKNVKYPKMDKVVCSENAEFFDSFGQNWGDGINQLCNTIYLNAIILSKKNIAKNLIDSGIEKVGIQISEGLLQPIKILESNLNLVRQRSDQKLDSPKFAVDFSVQKIFDESYEKITQIINGLPEEFVIPVSIYSNAELIAFNDYNSTTINLRKLANFALDTLFAEPFYREIEQLGESVNNALLECKEANSLLVFQLNNRDFDADSLDVDLKFDVEIFDKLQKQIEVQKSMVNTALQRIDHYSKLHLNESFSKLFYHSIVDSETKISSEKRNQNKQKLRIAITHNIAAIQRFVNRGIINLLNSTSKGSLLSKKYFAKAEKRQTQIQEVLNLRDQVKSNAKVYNSIPVFYRNLMSSSSKIHDEFWIPRNKEMQQLRDSLQRHRNGIGGAVIVKGAHGSGKTTFSRYATSHLFRQGNVFWINPPKQGSVSVAQFLTHLQEQIADMVDFNSIFSNLPFESVVVMNDLELWWERNPNGYAVMNTIIELIRNFGNKILFILNINNHSFNLIKQSLPLEENCLAIIDCEPFNAKEIQQLILSRHKSSGLTLTYGHRSEESVSQLTLSLLFNAYFGVSGGNPGVALNSWRYCITNIQGDSVFIKKPKTFNADVLMNLSPDWLITVALFIQHKNMDSDKLSRVLYCEKSHAENVMRVLNNSGIIVAKTKTTYTLERSIEPMLVDACLKKGLL